MSVKYKVVNTMNPVTQEKVYFPTLCESEQVRSIRVSNILSSRSSVSRSDVYNVLIGLADLIPELLASGYTVNLDGFGIFQLYAKAKSMDSPEKVNARNITGYTLGFRPDKHMKREIAKIKAEKA